MTVGRSTARTHQIGERAEVQAKHYLQEQGLSIVAENWHCPYGEIDLIAQQDDMLIFVEVRKRRSMHYGGAAASVTPAKQRKLLLTAQAYLAQHDPQGRLAARFDVLAYTGSAVQWIQDAFQASE